MTKAHPHRQVNVHLDTVDDADIIERIEAQPSMVGYVRKLVRCDIHDERLDYAALKESWLQAENAKLRELAESCLRESMRRCSTCPYELTAECEGCVLHENESRLREMGVVE